MGSLLLLFHCGKKELLLLSFSPFKHNFPLSCSSTSGGRRRRRKSIGGSAVGKAVITRANGMWSIAALSFNTYAQTYSLSIHGWPRNDSHITSISPLLPIKQSFLDWFGITLHEYIMKKSEEQGQQKQRALINIASTCIDLAQSSVMKIPLTDLQGGGD